MLAEAVKLVSDTTVSPEHNSTNQDCDLAVLSDPDELSLRLAYSSLVPGGYCYVEWGIHLLSKSNSIMKKLNSAGFDVIELYLPKPSPTATSPKIWIPLSSKRPIKYFMNNNFLRNNSKVLIRIARSLRLLLWSISPKFFMAYPGLFSLFLSTFIISSIARKPLSTKKDRLLNKDNKNLNNKTTTSYHSTNYLTKTIELSLKTLGLYKKSGRKPILMINPGRNTFNKSLLLVFAEKESKPSLVLKNTRTKKYGNYLINEARILKTLNNTHENINGIPRVLSYSYKSGIFSLGETYVDGTQLRFILTKNNYRELSLRLTSWLIDFALGTKTKLPDNWKTSFISNVLSDLSLSLGSELQQEFIQQTKEILTKLNIPNLICEHKDFTPQNIHIDDKGRIGVLDWEESKLFGLPGVDLIYFLTRMNYNYYNARSEEKDYTFQYRRQLYRGMLNESTFTGKITKECINLYATRVGIDNSAMDKIRLMTWLIQLHKEIPNIPELLHKEIPNSPEETKLKSVPEFLNANIAFALWEEEIFYQKGKT